MKNRAFWKAIQILSNPITLGAIAILFINDHLLRKVWPSWWTGKIGDFAWLYFAPFVAAALLAWLIPPKWKKQERIVGILAFGLIGGTFALANTLPSFHSWFSTAAEALLRIPIVIHRDPTDLIALASLWFGWRTWQKNAQPERSFSVAGWASLMIAAFLTIANSVPDPVQVNLGIDCLRFEDGVLRAHATPIHFYARHDTNFASTDGGLTWTEVENDPDYECSVFENNQIIDPNNDQVRYRVSPDINIERSVNGGSIWEQVYTLEPIEEAEETYYKRTRIDPVSIQPVPLDAIMDPATGNALFAMGHQGILVLTADGTWEWVSVGLHTRMDADYSSSIPRLLIVETTLTLSFALLGFMTLIQRNIKNPPFLIIIAVVWVFWVFSTITFSPNSLVTSGRYDIAEILCWSFIMITLGAALLFTIMHVAEMYKHHRGSLMRVPIIALIGAGLFFLPYFLWAIDIIPRYADALKIAIAAGAATLIIGDLWHRAYLQKLPADEDRVKTDHEEGNVR